MYSAEEMNQHYQQNKVNYDRPQSKTRTIVSAKVIQPLKKQNKLKDKKQSDEAADEDEV